MGSLDGVDLEDSSFNIGGLLGKVLDVSLAAVAEAMSVVEFGFMLDLLAFATTPVPVCVALRDKDLFGGGSDMLPLSLSQDPTAQIVDFGREESTTNGYFEMIPV